MEAMDVKYKPLMLPNGALKKLKPAAAVGGESLYRECLKNHAASLGGHALDGCGEFMPSPAANASDPTSLKCAACGCHRNFHRRLGAEGAPSPPTPPPPPLPLPMPMPMPMPPPHLLHGHPHRDEPPEERHPVVEEDSDDDEEDSEDDDERSASPPASAAPQQPVYFSSAPHMLLALSSGGPAAPSRPPAPAPAPPAASPASAGAMVARKRFRTKFSPEQKQRMQELSERLGWRLQKRDEAVVDEWCREIGVGKGVFKVWMHNNKHNFLGGNSARRSSTASAAAHHGDSTPPSSSAAAATAPTDFNINGAAASADQTGSGIGGHAVNGSTSPQSS